MQTIPNPYVDYVSPIDTIKELSDVNKIFNYELYTQLCDLTKSEQMKQLFWVNASRAYNAIIINPEVLVKPTGEWYPDNVYVYLGVDSTVVLTHPLLRMVIPNNSKDALYTSLCDESISVVVSRGLIPILKTLHKLIGVKIDDPVTPTGVGYESVTSESSGDINPDISILNSLPPSLLAAKYGNEERVGRGKRESKHDLIRLLLPYVDSEYDLVSLRTRNDVIWERLKSFDLTHQTTDGACLVNAGLNDSGQTVYKVFTSKWHITLAPTKSSVNSLYVKLCIASKDDIDDLRAIAAVVRKITNVINS